MAGNRHRVAIKAGSLLHHLSSYIVGDHEYTFVDTQDPWIDPIDKEFFLSREQTYYLPKDEQGVPVIRHGPRGAHHYRPGRVASYGLAMWNRYRRLGHQQSTEAFLKCAEWFMQFGDGRFVYHDEISGIKPPWISGLGQGGGISVLTRAYVLTGEARFLDQAQRAFLPMTKTFEEGGVRSALRDGSFFIEEYPLSDPGHVLNGFLLAVFGIMDLHRSCPTDQTHATLNACWDSLVRNIEQWDLSGWSAYDLHNLQSSGLRNYCTVNYHSLHIASLRYAHKLTAQHIFWSFAERWEAGLQSLSTRLRAMMGKTRYRSQYPTRYLSRYS